MATSGSKMQEGRTKRALVPSHKLTDSSNSAIPELSTHATAIALKRAEEARRLTEKEASAASASTLSAETSASLQPVSPAKRL
jgi:hypothetical protein